MKNLLVSILVIFSVFQINTSRACTNFLITKGASIDNSVLTSYACDSHDIYGELYFWPAKDHPVGSSVRIVDWITGKYLGNIPQISHTYRVIGNMNEHQLVVTESTWGGREELTDSTGIIDIGSLIYLTLQRAKDAREAIRTFHFLTSEYGYYSTGETFTIADKNEAWILDLIGKDHGKKGAVWVARKVPDGYISGHANHARITNFPKQNKKTSISSDLINNNKYLYHSDLECIYASDVISFAKEMNYIDSKTKHDDFNFADTYNPISFGAARFCEARVFAGFNRVNSEMGQYLDYAMGENLTNRFPLWIKPDKKIGVRDLMELMRDYYQGTPMDMTKDVGAGSYESTVRWRPITWEVNGERYFHERAISTQQTAFSIVAQCRADLPDPIGGILWFGVDDTYLTVYNPLYAGLQESPEMFKLGNGDILNYSETSAFWLFNRVSNNAYNQMSRVYPSIREKQNELELGFIESTKEMDQKALEVYKSNPQEAVNMLSEFSLKACADTWKTWKTLDNYLLVRFSDGNIKGEQGTHNNYVRELFNKEFDIPAIEQPGYSKDYYENIVRDTKDKQKIK
ncbi:MAG: C69 family dipeptidase [Bacteroidales bacterium]|nr:C69 family dipeptidase [Bacteroidales bacterium]